MKLIPLTRSKFAIVDDEDYDNLINIKFYYGNKYAVCNKKVNGTWKNVPMHHIILGKPRKGYVIDHINRNPLDNRKCNLRICTQSNNSMNRIKLKKSSSKYKGVSFCKRNNKYKSHIKINGVLKYLGTFQNEELAALKYNESAIELFGEYAMLNIINP